MLKRSLWKKAFAWVLCAMIVATSFAFRADAAFADETDKSEMVDYVLILDCTVKAVEADKEGVRKAAAKMFVDLLPVDNARVSVFKIGAPDKNVDNNHPEDAKSYKLRADNEHVANAVYRMRTIYQLWDFEQKIDTIDQREKLKSIIDEAYVQRKDENNYSDIHCAVYAALDALKLQNSSNACILLVSEEFAMSYVQHRVVNANGIETDSDHTMWDDIRDTLSDHRNWVFNWVDLGKDSPQVRTIIDELCRMNDGEACYDFNISRLPEMIATVVSKYTESNDEGKKQTLDASGNADITLPDFVMLTEANVVVTGDGVERVTVTDGNGSRIEKPKDDIWFSTNYDPQDRTRFLYSAVKMIRPSSGAWTINVKGKAGTQVYVQTIQTLEPDINFWCNVKPGENIGVGTKLQFTAVYTYDGKELHCGNSAYEHYLKSAKLKYSHSSNPKNLVDISELLHVDSEQYVAEFTVRERGTYNFYFYVESYDFRSRIRHATPIENITVENHAPVVVEAKRPGDIDDVPVGTKLDGKIDVGGLFADPDNEPLTYFINCSKDGRPLDENDLGAMLTLEGDNFLTIQAPEKEGEFIIELSAADGNGASSPIVSFALRTKNEPPVLTGKSKSMDTVRMIANAPKALVSMGLLPKDECKAYTVNVRDLFEDPEGLPLSFSLDTSDTVDGDGKDIVDTSYDKETGELTVTAENKGQAVLTITTMDSSDETKQLQISFKVKNVGTVLLARYWWFLALLALLVAICIILLISRRVKGRWLVEVEDHENRGSCSHEFRSLASSRDRMLKRTKVSLLSMAKCSVILEHATDIKLNRLPADAVVFHGSLSQGKTVTFNCVPRARVAVFVGETALTARKKYKLTRRDELTVVCKDADNEEILTVKVSFQ